VVTSAAVIMVAVFAVFGTLSLQQFKQISVGLAVAVLLDATLIRGVLLPSVMTVLGEHNWYLPRWLSWLPKASDPSGAPPTPAPLPTPARPPAGSPVRPDPAGLRARS
jgi:RND superfamily putative drug exporter